VDRHLRRQHAGRQLPLRRQRLGAPVGQKEFGTRREIKNLNSFRFMQQAIDFEVQWQINEITEGRAIRQATVLFDPDTGETRSMRTKEDAHDYRYFPDPDLLPLEIGANWIAEVKAGLPELPQAMQARFQADYGLSAYDAAILTSSRGMADYYVAAVAVAGAANGKTVANWIMGELAARLNKNDIDIGASPISATQLAGLIQRIADNTISNNIAKKVFEALWSGEGRSADEIIEKQGLKQITDTGAIEKIIDEVLAANAEVGRGIPRRQGEGLQRPGRSGDEGDQGQGQPAAGQRTAEEETGRLRRKPGGSAARRLTSSRRAWQLPGRPEQEPQPLRWQVSLPRPRWVSCRSIPDTACARPRSGHEPPPPP
jgi:hypothetical protein